MTIATTEKAAATFGAVGITAAEVEGLLTGEFPGIPDDYTDAEILDHKVRKAFAISLHAQDYLVAVVHEAKSANIHKTLISPETGKAYRSWTDYISRVLAAQNVDVKGLSARQRAVLIATLYNTGMSQGAVAKALSIGIATVNRAIQTGRESGDVDKDRKTIATDGREFYDTETEGATTKGKAPRSVATAKRLVAAAKTLNAALAEDEMTVEQVAEIASLLKEAQAELSSAKKATK